MRDTCRNLFLDSAPTICLPALLSVDVERNCYTSLLDLIFIYLLLLLLS